MPRKRDLDAPTRRAGAQRDTQRERNARSVGKTVEKLVGPDLPSEPLGVVRVTHEEDVTEDGWVVFQVKVSTRQSPSPVMRRAGIAEIKVAPDASTTYDVIPKLANAVKALGNNTVADLLGVSRSQPGRWVRSQEGVSQDNEAAILDLDFVLSLLLRTMSAELAGIWLVSPNAFLGDARPIDALRIEGHRRVVEAIQAYAEGAYA